MTTTRHGLIRSLFDGYIETYASRDERLTSRFNENLSGFSGGSCLVTNRKRWVEITRQDFAQVPGIIRIEMLDLCLQDLSDGIVSATAFFHIGVFGANAYALFSSATNLYAR